MTNCFYWICWKPLKKQKFTSDLNYDAFLNNEIIKDAVSRDFEIIGESSNRINTDGGGSRALEIA